MSEKDINENNIIPKDAQTLFDILTYKYPAILKNFDMHKLSTMNQTIDNISDFSHDTRRTDVFLRCLTTIQHIITSMIYSKDHDRQLAVESITFEAHIKFIEQFDAFRLSSPEIREFLDSALETVIDVYSNLYNILITNKPHPKSKDYNSEIISNKLLLFIMDNLGLKTLANYTISYLISISNVLYIKE